MTKGFTAELSKADGRKVVFGGSELPIREDGTVEGDRLVGTWEVCVLVVEK